MRLNVPTKTILFDVLVGISYASNEKNAKNKFISIQRFLCVLKLSFRSQKYKI